MIAFLILFLVSAALVAALVMYGLAVLLGVRPLVLEVGFGPKMFEVPVAGTRVRARLFTTGAFLSWIDGDQRAGRFPDLPRRLAVTLAVPAVLLAASLAILGAPALGQVGRGFGQLLQLCWPFGDGGVELVAGFDALLDSRGDLVAAGVLSAKLCAFNLVFSAIQPGTWRGYDSPERTPIGWVVLFAFVSLAIVSGTAINVARSVVTETAAETEAEAEAETAPTPAPATAPAPAPAPALEIPDAAPRLKLRGLFDAGECHFGVNAHCRKWGELAGACDGGDAGACVELGELLIGESPMQPLWGSLFLQRACELGRDEQCAPALRWSEWSKYGYSNLPVDGVAIPDGLEDACEGGDPVACGLLQMRRPTDAGAALAACRAGFRDVCARLVDRAADPAELIAALEAGCDLPDAFMCWHLAGFYSSYCADPADRHAACPPADPAKAERYRRLACQLEPEMRQCRP